jgi:hypothetical protein
VPAQALPEPLPNWNTDPAGNFTPLTDPSLGVAALPDVFNMNPTEFGLSYQIFVVDEAITLTSTYVVPPAATQEPASPPQNNLTTFKGRQSQLDVPGPCFTWCNNALLEAQSSGKTSKLCQPNSAYLITVDSCRVCINAHRSQPSENAFLRIAPQFQQFQDYCAGFLTTTLTSFMTSATTSGTNISTTVVPTTYVTAIPTSDIVETVIPTTVTSNFVSTSVSGIAPEPPSTITGDAVTDITVLFPTNGTISTLSGSDLIGATLILPAVGASQSEMVTSGSSVYTTEVTGTIIGSSTLGEAGETAAQSQSASATSSGPAVDTGNSMAGSLEAPKAFIVGAIVMIGFAL